MTHPMNDAMQRCIAECLACYRTCQHEAMNHCLEAGGKHLEPAHFRLMIDCAEMCRTSAHFMLSGSAHHHVTCGACAEICDACAKSCETVGNMDDCVQACRRCAESCRKMSGASASAGLAGSTSQTSDASAKAPM